ncbi:hypothetical protein M107_2604 [Bacteroides fragilis str. 3725 D9(v)]|uniref:Uncharacterized protein n=3 Tax=Bacteroides fragilis TaxID=817 RepID=A0A015XEM1_BACFG|nr:hypothetical protein M101_1692 [Bacteroides fragilis str. 1007-1-F \
MSFYLIRFGLQRYLKTLKRRIDIYQEYINPPAIIYIKV